MVGQLLAISLLLALLFVNSLNSRRIRAVRRSAQRGIAMANTPTSPGSRNTKPKKLDLLKKYTSSREVGNMQLGPDGLPLEKLRASRPTKYKPILASGGSKGKRIMNQGSAREKEIINPNRLRILGGTAKGKKIDS